MELSTGDFAATEFDGDAAATLLREELGVLAPRELLLPTDADLDALRADGTPLPAVTRRERWQFALDAAQRALTEQLQTTGLAGFGLDGHPHAIGAAGALVQYLRDTQKGDLTHVRSIAYRETRDGLIIDATTLRHLEVLASTEGDRQVSLLGVLDDTVTAMGARLLRAWLTKPLVALEAIRDRLDAVEDLAFRSVERGTLRDTLKQVYDVQRLVARAALGTAGPRDLVALAQLARGRARAAPDAGDAAGAAPGAALAGQLDDLPALRERITGTLADEPPMLARDGDVIRDGADPEVDRLRGLSRGGKSDISAMEEAERQRTGIASLKIRFNRVFGYYIEISKSNLHAVPADYIRKQTIAGGERFITPGLKTYEEQVLHADEHLIDAANWRSSRRSAARWRRTPRRCSARRRRWRRSTCWPRSPTTPRAATTASRTCTTATTSSVIEGRHPVVETMTREAFVPNDLSLDGTTQQLLVITGPEHGRQEHLPAADGAALPDGAGRIVRAGAPGQAAGRRSHLRAGRRGRQHRARPVDVHGRDAGDGAASSTPRRRAASSCSTRSAAARRPSTASASPGRSPSTSPTNPKARPKTLFATHYHELTDLADALPGVANAHLLVREWQDQIVFLRKVVPGRSDRSYGIQVARLAGLPASVIRRAREILNGLEQDELVARRPSHHRRRHDAARGRSSSSGCSRPPPDDRLRERLREVDVNSLTPLQALTLLAELKDEVDG